MVKMARKKVPQSARLSAGGGPIAIWVRGGGGPIAIWAMPKCRGRQGKRVFPYSLTWRIENSTGALVAYDGGKIVDSYTKYIEAFCLDSSECYNFTIYDSYGDGICCSQGSGSYTVKVNDDIVLTGGEFTLTETKPLYCLYGEETINGQLV